MLTANSKLDKVLKLGNPCRCMACENSCNYGSGALAKGDMEKLAAFLEVSEKELKEKYFEEITKFNKTLFRPKLLRKEDMPYGKCIFYDNVKGCIVHEAKPLECKVAMGCKSYGEELITWFDLNHFIDKKDPESMRQFKIYMDAGGKVLPGWENLVDKKLMEKGFSYEDLKDDTDWEAVLGLKGEKNDRK